MSEKINESDKLWEEVRNLQISLFALPNQKVEQHVERLAGSKTELFLKLKSPAVLPALESVLNAQQLFKTELRYDRPHAEPEQYEVSYPKYSMVETEGGYVIVKYHSSDSEKKELEVHGDFFISEKEESNK